MLITDTMICSQTESTVRVLCERSWLQADTLPVKPSACVELLKGVPLRSGWSPPPRPREGELWGVPEVLSPGAPKGKDPGKVLDWSSDREGERPGEMGPGRVQ